MNARMLSFAAAMAALGLAAVSAAAPADDALKALQDGNARFIAGKPENPHSGLDRVADTGANGQKPQVTLITCSDSRLPVERIFDQGVGDVFVVRVAGNVSDTDEIGSAEYGCGHLKTPLLVVLGHTKCGAVTAVATGAEVHGSIPGLVDNIIPAVEAAKKKHPGVSGKDLVPFAIDENVYQSMRDLLTHSEEIRDLVKSSKVSLVGGVYDIETGAVRWLGKHPEESALLTAPPAAAPAKADAGHGDAAHAEPAAASSHAPAAGKAVSGAAAEASKLTATGQFAAPDLKTATRAAFGAKAGNGSEMTLPQPAEQGGAWAFWAFAGGAGVVLVGTLGAVFVLSRTRDRSGAPARALTLGAKLAGGFGTLAAMTLAVSAIAVRSNTQINTAMAEIEDIGSDAQLVAAMQADLLATRMSGKGFLLTNADEDLVKFSDASSNFAKKANQAKTAITDPKAAPEIAQMIADFEEYQKLFARAVAKIDERNGIVDSQMGPAAERATALLQEIARTAHDDGDPEVGFTAEKTLGVLQEARLNFFKFLRKADDKFAQAAVQDAEETKSSLKELAAEIKNPKRRAWMAEAEQAVAFWVTKMEHAESLQKDRNELVKNGLDKIGPKIAAAGDGLLKAFAQREAKVTEEASAAAAAAKLQVVTLGTVVAVFALATAFLIARGAITSLGRLEASLKDIAQGEGDLTVTLDDAKRDELGRVATYFNQFVAKIREVVAQTAGVSAQVAAAATEVAASAEEMSASVSEVASQCARASESASSSGRLATEGGQVVEQTVSGIKEIDSAVSASAQSVSALGARGEEIGKVIDVIRDIADQTNLLALNAAIEAARAGEHGRGFAVVADEVRSLAERTTKATEEITGNIGAIQRETQQAVERMARGTEQVKVGVESAAKASANLKQIVEGATSVAGMITTIASAAEEAGAGATQAATAASDLSNKAEQLKALMSGFKV
jgi:methyl-accepting chemotaxis protein/carbonic anhydrase